MSNDGPSDWERLLAAERHLQALLPDAVLVGGTAAALHAGHRLSLDGDHVLADLRDRFDEPPWSDWRHVTARGRAWAQVLADLLLAARDGQP